MGLVRRRHFLIAACAALSVPNIVRAQATRKLPVLAYLSPHRTPTPEQIARSLINVRLRELGWVDGKTFLIERANGEGRENRLPELAAMLVERKVDVIWALGPEAAVAAARATKTIPIVFWGVPFPVEQGLIDSFARPGGNVTGVAWYASPEVAYGKRLELLREIAPGATRMASIFVTTTLRTVGGERLKIQSNIAATAQKMGYEQRAFPVAEPEDVEPALAAILAWGAQALSVPGTTLMHRERHRIAEFALSNRLPSVFTLRDYVEAGGLVSYAIDWRPTMAQTGYHVDRILRGARPADLPVQLPSRYETAVNRKTAAALGLTIPPSILLRADRVID